MKPPFVVAWLIITAMVYAVGVGAWREAFLLSMLFTATMVLAGRWKR